MIVTARSALTGVAAVVLAVTGIATAAAEDQAHASTATTQVAKPHPWPVTNPPARARWMKVSCRQEDSTNCSWNAQEQGNGVGHSFYVVRRSLENPRGVRMGQVTCVFYVKMADHKWDACHITKFRAS